MTGSAAGAPIDAGLAASRTTLSWTRTGLAAAALGVLMLRNGLAGGRPLLATALFDAVAICLVGRRRAVTMHGALVVPMLASTPR